MKKLFIGGLLGIMLIPTFAIHAQVAPISIESLTQQIAELQERLRLMQIIAELQTKLANLIANASAGPAVNGAPQATVVVPTQAPDEASFGNTEPANRFYVTVYQGDETGTSASVVSGNNIVRGRQIRIDVARPDAYAKSTFEVSSNYPGGFTSNRYRTQKNVIDASVSARIFFTANEVGTWDFTFRVPNTDISQTLRLTVQ